MTDDVKSMKASPISRIGAALVDIMIAFVLYFVVSSFILVPIVTNATDYDEQYKVYETTLLSTDLFFKSESTNQLACVIDRVNEKNEREFSAEKTKEYDQLLIDFYKVYDESKIETFNESKKENVLFTYNEETLTYDVKADADVSSLYSFYQKEMSNALQVLLDNNETMRKAYNQMNFYSNVITYTSYGLSFLITFMLFPLISKNGRTLGKHFFGLNVIDMKNPSEPIKKWKVAVRELCYIAVGLFLSLLCWGIPLFIILVFTCISKLHLAPYDYITSTMVADQRFVPVKRKVESEEGTIVQDSEIEKEVIEVAVNEDASPLVNEEKIEDETLSETIKNEDE